MTSLMKQFTMTDTKIRPLSALCNISIKRYPKGDDAKRYIAMPCYWMNVVGNSENVYDASENHVNIKREYELIVEFESDVLTTAFTFCLWNIESEISRDYLFYSLKTKKEQITECIWNMCNKYECYDFENLAIGVPSLQDINGLRKIYKSSKRLRRLMFCERLHDVIDEFRYRPSGAGCREVRGRNKGRFIDL